MARKPSKKSEKNSVKSKIKTAAKKTVKHAVKKVLKKKAVKKFVSKVAKKKPLSSAGKATLKLKTTVKSLPQEVLEWVKTHNGEEAAKVAVEKFGVSYAHLTDWLKKEGMQVKEAVESLIEARKKDAVKKGESKLKELSKSLEAKKTEFKKLAQQIKTAAKK